MGTYATLLKQRDNFIYASIKAEDKNMQKLWLNRAKETEKEMKKLYNKSIQEV